jgi:hypothetical protein
MKWNDIKVWWWENYIIMKNDVVKVITWKHGIYDYIFNYHVYNQHELVKITCNHIHGHNCKGHSMCNHVVHHDHNWHGPAIATIIMSIGTTNTIFNNAIDLVWVTKLKSWNYEIWYFHLMVCRHMITINKTNNIMWLFQVYFIINYNINTCSFNPIYC